MAVAEAIAAIRTALAADPALAAVAIQDYPPDQITRSLTLMIYPREGDWGVITLDGQWDGTADIRIRLDKKRPTTEEGGLEAGIQALEPFYDAVPRILLTAWLTDQFAGTVRQLGRPGQRELRCDAPGPDNWSGIDTVTIRWTLTVTPA